MSVSQSIPIDSPIKPYAIVFRFVGATVLTGLLVTFLVITRWFATAPEPDQTIREIALLQPAAPPSPEPPIPDAAEPEPPSPPQKVPDLPQLDFQVEQVAPPVRAVINKQSVDFTMQTIDFELETDPIVPIKKSTPTKKSTYTPPKKSSTTRSAPKPAPKRTTYSSSELDGKPRLLNRPRATYPSSMLRKGVRSGKVLLEVSISPSGRCSVRRVISSSHSDFSTMARSFASSARFSVPKKDGRAVTAIYKWPLVLKP